MDRIDRDELASFLRERRARVRPEDVGLTSGRRRQVDGLRRQEVAQLAGMSVDYYIRLEQARGPRPSREILTAVARALQLADSERGYLFSLAGEPEPTPRGPARDVRPGILRTIDRLDDTPAMVCDAAYDVLAWNEMATALLGDYGAVPREHRNVVERHFLDTEARARHDEEGALAFARLSVAHLRAAAARYPDYPRVHQLVSRLREHSSEFAELWDLREIGVRPSSSKRIHHPAVGWVELECEALHDPERDHWVILYTAAPGTAAHDALHLLRVLGRQELSSSRG